MGRVSWDLVIRAGYPMDLASGLANMPTTGSNEAENRGEFYFW